MDSAVWAPTFAVDAVGADHRLLCHTCGETWLRPTMVELLAVVGRHTEEARCARGICGGPVAVLALYPPLDPARVEFHSAAV